MDLPVSYEKNLTKVKNLQLEHPRVTTSKVVTPVMQPLGAEWLKMIQSLQIIQIIKDRWNSWNH